MTEDADQVDGLPIVEVQEPVEFNQWHQQVWSPLGELLIADGHLTKEQEQALLAKWVEEAWVPLGVILIQDRILKVSEVARLLEQQLDEPEVPIGQLAVRMGYCSQATIQEALTRQNNLWIHPLEFVRRALSLSTDDLWDTVLAYLRRLELNDLWPPSP